ncbi:uncharacterized protein LOC135099118 isoform X2 [Scylla paramamosain]|uniref:uncharacterized protein LOC135099118 isoform X2 n=1 Tax=Scylla paramamosain TaxID=85552 RepID=UPI003082C6AF
MMTSDMNLALESVEVLKGAIHNAVKVPQNTQAQVQGCLNMPATYNTVVARTQLAHQFYEHVSEVARMCCQLVHDQHLQQQVVCDSPLFLATHQWGEEEEEEEEKREERRKEIEK